MCGEDQLFCPLCFTTYLLRKTFCELYLYCIRFMFLKSNIFLLLSNREIFAIFYSIIGISSLEFLVE